jgi:glucose-1-phosphate thymidylyltransferase
METNIQVEIMHGNLIMAKVEVLKGTVLGNCTICGPVIIAENCRIIDSFIGPYTSIGPKTIIEKSHIENSIIMGNSHISNVRHLVDSVVGRNTKIDMQFRRDRNSKIFLGDDTTIEL